VTRTTTTRLPAMRNDAGFTLIELMISVGILMTISALMMRGTLDMTNLNRKQSNLSEMHAGIRNATALLQQEVGQAGRLAFPAPVTVAAAIPLGDQWVIVAPSVTSMFVGEKLVILGSNASGDVEEIVTVTAVDTAGNSIRAVFATSYFAGARVMPAGGFAEGVIPTTKANGSTSTKLKIVGDINSDGNIMYVEYTCDWNAGRLYRNMMAYDAAAKPALAVEQVLLDNLLPNPPDPTGIARPCFTYDQRTIYGNTYVINVAIMTTVRTDERDQTTGQFQTVTKALLNVAPRNVFNVWQVASLNYRSRIEPLPASVLALLP
jgi:prepilin-type N-terminal cleavage/methylation domain-containing protein